MDGQRPEEELSEALVLTKVLGFRTPEEGDRVFVVEEIPAPSTTTTVVRPMSKEDGAVRRAPYLPKARSVAYYVQEPGCRRLELESHWEGLLAEVPRMFFQPGRRSTIVLTILCRHCHRPRRMPQIRAQGYC